MSWAWTETTAATNARPATSATLFRLMVSPAVRRGGASVRPTEGRARSTPAHDTSILTPFRGRVWPMKRNVLIGSGLVAFVAALGIGQTIAARRAEAQAKDGAKAPPGGRRPDGAGG